MTHANAAHDKIEERVKVTGLRAKGKIPSSEWASIVRRHLDGETSENIARTYRCTAPAIRYIIRKSAAKAAGSQLAEVNASRPRPDEAGNDDRRPAGPQPSRELGRDLMLRANSDVATFVVALEEAATKLDAETTENLRDATDRLLQSCARTILAIERMRPSLVPEAYRRSRGG
jgi:hypothetical protein